MGVESFTVFGSCLFQYLPLILGGKHGARGLWVIVNSVPVNKGVVPAVLIRVTSLAGPKMRSVFL